MAGKEHASTALVVGMASLNTSKIAAASIASFPTVPVAGMASLNTNEIVVAWLASQQYQ